MPIMQCMEYADRVNFKAMDAVLRDYEVVKNGIGVEVGVRNGDFSSYLLECNPKLSLYLVDPYLPYLDLGTPFTQEMQDKIKKRAIERLMPFEERAIWINKPSVAAAKEVNIPVDFVFIDAEHTAKAVEEDIQAWVGKIRIGGLLSGHDFRLDDVSGPVLEYAKYLDTPVYHIPGKADVWYISING